jgi:hypothetical protein
MQLAVDNEIEGISATHELETWYKEAVENAIARLKVFYLSTRGDVTAVTYAVRFHTAKYGKRLRLIGALDLIYQGRHLYSIQLTSTSTLNKKTAGRERSLRIINDMVYGFATIPLVVSGRGYQLPPMYVNEINRTSELLYKLLDDKRHTVYGCLPDLSHIIPGEPEHQEKAEKAQVLAVMAVNSASKYEEYIATIFNVDELRMESSEHAARGKGKQKEG